MQQISITKVSELLYIDLIGPIQVESIAGKHYIFVYVDDFSRFTWIDFSREKSDRFDAFINLYVKLQNEKSYNIRKIVRIRSDHGKTILRTLFMLISVIDIVSLMNVLLPKHHKKKCFCGKKKLYLAGNGLCDAKQQEDIQKTLGRSDKYGLSYR